MLYRFFSYFAIGFFLCLVSSCTANTEAKPLLTSDDFFEPEQTTMPNAIANSTFANEVKKGEAKSKKSDKPAISSEEKTNQKAFTPQENKKSHLQLVNGIKKDIIAMVYPESYKSSNVKILKESTNGDQLELKIAVSWTDQWVKSPYIIEGLLKVNTDGSNAHFKIIHKNAQAEALEITYDNFKEEISLAKI